MKKNRIRPPAIEFRIQLISCFKIATKQLKSDPDSFRALLLADFLAELASGMLRAPRELTLASDRLGRLKNKLGDKAFWEKARMEGLGHILAGFWWSFQKAKWLDKRITIVFGKRIARLLTHPAHLYYFQQDGLAIGGREHAKIYTEALHKICPSFHTHKDHFKIDAACIQIDPPFERDPGISVEFYPDGHLKKIGYKEKKKHIGPILELAQVPGSGKYRHEGKSGGYGFLVDETYENGGVHGTYYSPWHDGEEYIEKKPWIVWVLECVGSVKKYAEKLTNARIRRTRRA